MGDSDSCLTELPTPAWVTPQDRKLQPCISPHNVQATLLPSSCYYLYTTLPYAGPYESCVFQEFPVGFVYFLNLVILSPEEGV